MRLRLHANLFVQSNLDARAKAVTGYLVELGAKTDKMKTIGYGEERPAAEGHSESAWSRNRRTDFLLELGF